MRNNSLPLNLIYIAAAVISLAVLGTGLYLASSSPHEWTMLAGGCVCVVAVAVTWPLALSLGNQRAVQDETHEAAGHLQTRIDEIYKCLSRVSEQQLLSDRAKSVAYRDKDREAIRRAIHEEMDRREWDAAFALADQFEKAFGSHNEAERFRKEINTRRADEVRQEINEVVAVIDRHTRAEQWNAALRDAEKLMKRFPNDEQVRHLPQEIENRRQGHKKQLLASWHEAVARHDVDGSIEILRQLDTYLTPAEAETMQDTARGVFKEKLNNLGAGFANAVRDHRWQEAIRLGEQIQREFPNSRIAQEVQEKMATLRQRASETAAAPA